MNYCPNNFYTNYPYNNSNNMYGMYNQQTPQINSPSPSQPMLQPQGLQGKIVDGEEMVRVTEVPLGGYGIFPKADFSEVYIKTWNNNGNTSVIKYKPIENEISNDSKEISNIDTILNKVQSIEDKLDTLFKEKNNNEKKEEKNNNLKGAEF